jgi:SAM-dependent methyltransferase
MNFGIFEILVRSIELIIRALFPSLIIFIYRNSNPKKRKLIKQLKQSESTKENNFEEIYKHNFWQNKESLSGYGSSVKNTGKIRAALPKLWEKYGINSFLDAPCGDFNWMNQVDKSEIEYIGCDIVHSIIEKNQQSYTTENVRFYHLDLTTDDLPKADMIMCRDCFQHISYENIHKILANFKRSGAKYLLLTTYPATRKNWDTIIDGDYRPLNISIAPFHLTNHIETIKEGMGGALDRTMYLYEL